MPDDEARLKIAKKEGNDTFTSITDLDNLNDTALVGITFLLTALVTWTAFAYSRVVETLWLTISFFIIAIGCVAASIGCVYFLTAALSPRGFYGKNVGKPFLYHKWQIWKNNEPLNISNFERVEDADNEDLESSVDDWIDRYDPNSSIDSYDDFVYSRLLNYKYVARIKAQHTAYAMALFKIAAVLLGLLVLLGLVGPLAADTLQHL